MKTFYATVFALSIGAAASAQCLTISCNSNITTNNDPNACGAVVTYTTPTVVSNTCPLNASDTFDYTGAQQIFTVPPGVTSIFIETWGAQGGANWVNNTNFGGYVAGTISVTPGEQLYVYVGGQATSVLGGFNGGGNGEGAGKGGGGGSDVRQGGSTYNDRVVCAGGGGGAGYWSNLHVVGGQGGGLTGGNGYRDPDFVSNPGGKGATQSAGGADGTCVNFNVTTCAGGFGYGGSITGCGCEVYGGGGGWYGGAASGNCRGGGGGSGYAIGTATNVAMNTGVRAGNGMVVISYAGAPATITQTAGLPSGAQFPVGVTTNTFIADDGIGNMDTCSFTVTVVDADIPVLAALSNISTSVDANSCGAVVSWAAPTATDNCTVTVTAVPNSGSFFPIGTSTVTVTASDGVNSDIQTFTVTVNDTIAPVITNLPSGITVGNDASMCDAVVTWPAVTVTDNCGGWTLTSTHNSGDVFPVGSTTVTYMVVDSTGLTDTASFVVTVNDTESPSIFSCAFDMTVSADAGMCSASNVMLGSPMSLDNCTVTVSNDAPAVFPVGATVVTWTVTDVGGNTATCMQTVTVEDNEAPVIGCPMDLMACEGVVSFLPPAAMDNCSSTTVSQVSGPVSGSTLAPGLYTIVFAAVDSAGNADSCSFVLTVNANPVISTSNPSTVCVTDGNYTLSATPAGGTWSGPGVSGTTFSPSTAGNGAQALTYSVTNANGCSATSIDTITVAPCTGINEAGAVTFTLFPNPANTTFTFTADQHGTVVLMDALGNVVLTKTIVDSQTEIGVDGLATGMYTVRFTSTSGAISTGKLQVLR